MKIPGVNLIQKQIRAGAGSQIIKSHSKRGESLWLYHYRNLPYGKDALAPVISANTLDFHYGKHHKAYVDNLNKLIAGTELAEKPLEEIIKIAAKDSAKAGIFNNAAQVWNHSFYWQCLKKSKRRRGHRRNCSKNKLQHGEAMINLSEELKNAGVTQFGSGWAWLVLDGSQLKITKTANADTPLAHGQKPLLTIDVWEHAYYLDYQNRRPDYIAAVIDNLINWDFVNANLG